MTVKSLLICLALICGLLLTYSTANERYSSKYDDVNVDEVLANPRLRNQYVSCLVNTSPCVTGAARFLKGNYSFFSFLLPIDASDLEYTAFARLLTLTEFSLYTNHFLYINISHLYCK